MKDIVEPDYPGWLSGIYFGRPGRFSIDRNAWRERKMDSNGSDVIVKDVAFSNLLEILDVFKSFGITVWPINGTLLGLVRDGELIAHDSDVDLGSLWSERYLIRDALIKLRSSGFEIIRVSQKTTGVSIMRDDEYVDISLYKIEWGFFHRYLTSAWGAIDPVRLSLPLIQLQIGGHNFSVPKRYEQLLRFWFGDSWRIPERGKSRRCDVPSIRLKNMIKTQLKTTVDRVYLVLR